jgi:hypothetical protein
MNLDFVLEFFACLRKHGDPVLAARGQAVNIEIRKSNNMKFTQEQLKSVMDMVRLDPTFAPKPDGTTYCNYNAFRVAAGLGCPEIWAPLKEGQAMANNMISHMDAHPEIFFKFADHMKAWQMVNDGSLVFAALKAAEHGHICPIYPSVGMETSGKWRTQVPSCSDVGKSNGIKGINFAFATEPNYYAVV